jgi:hypothetical protein
MKRYFRSPKQNLAVPVIPHRRRRKIASRYSALAREMFGNAGRGGHDAKSFECASDANQPMVL